MGLYGEQGATTIWELWNGNTANPAMNSGNHVMLLGDFLPWCYENLAGIKSERGRGKVGFKQSECVLILRYKILAMLMPVTAHLMAGE